MHDYVIVNKGQTYFTYVSLHQGVGHGHVDHEALIEIIILIVAIVISRKAMATLYRYTINEFLRNGTVFVTKTPYFKVLVK